MGLQRRLGIYVGFYSPFIIQHMEPCMSNVLMTHFDDVHFDEIIFPLLGKGKHILEEWGDIICNAWNLSHLDLSRLFSCKDLQINY